MCRFPTFLLIAIAITMLPTILSITCFVGKNSVVAEEKDFDYCATMKNISTKEITYSGRTGATRVFEKDANDLTINNCYIDFNDQTALTCYCRRSKCNKVVSSLQFDLMTIATK
ncbi:uncharacterized protein CELE_EGAP4.1 [Caenorhabditis elegans]|uniref:Uncharacterized protein EGAP4.1 n=1 Tax=Caenorhabditis elegans TaxID=6239 RepID=YEGP4_CAEEL|nr:Uncharacterized protein CELE_EGAP4.1 [Caenorhabditis elegans]Q19077.1 RecName: Full=Uncharacterized protein EGAP4.1; Flags: Precursor [Caenorhabditis elegans]CCD68790.1 Uncharacterized protein CELE_EGAP4.1 [Caenorhabditis elegans]|eukprot:NP_509480.1 Uncharacterized protein CELE_EGAP4.1 [Caenorhabditis elegans]